MKMPSNYVKVFWGRYLLRSVSFVDLLRKAQPVSPSGSSRERHKLTGRRKRLLLSSHDTEVILTQGVKRKVNRSSLSDLPAEILRLICTFLPLSSATALTLCNFTTFLKLGSDFSHKLYIPTSGLQSREDTTTKTQFEQREAFLGLLEKDLPIDIIFCHYCQKLHDYQASDLKHSMGKGTRPCTTPEIKVPPSSSLPRPTPFFSNEFLDHNFSRLQILMKRYRMNAESFWGVAGLYAYETIRTDGSYTQELTCRARIYSGKLIFRIKHIVSFPEQRKELPPEFILRVCSHHVAHTTVGPLKIFDNIKDHLSHHDGCQPVTIPTLCKWCDTEYQINCNPKKKGRSIVVRVW